MAEDEYTRRSDQDGQSIPHRAVMMSESIMDTLKILNYEAEFCYPNTYLRIYTPRALHIH